MGRNMHAYCKWHARMVEGALRRGDWVTARERIGDWETGIRPCCAGICAPYRGYLHGLSLKLKIMGPDAIRQELEDGSQSFATKLRRTVGA